MRRAGEREGREKRTTAVEAGLKGIGGGAGGGGVPGKQTTGEKGQSLEARRQEGGRHQGHSGRQTPSSCRMTTMRGWIIIRLLAAGFPF